jgi:hypothetical protein
MIGRRCHITPLYVFPNHHIHEQINNNNRPFERQLDLDSLDIHTWFEEKKKRCSSVIHDDLQAEGNNQTIFKTMF